MEYGKEMGEEDIVGEGGSGNDSRYEEVGNVRRSEKLKRMSHLLLRLAGIVIIIAEVRGAEKVERA